jgi:hypothetical protein
MKKTILFLLTVLISTSMLMATTFYVNGNHGNASDTNVGTDPAAPWQTLNFSKWGSSRTDGDTIRVAAGTYTYGATTGSSIVKSIFIIGESKASVIIQGIDDATFNNRTVAGNAGNVKFAKIAAVTPAINTVKFKSMTLRNSIVKSASTYDGGFFEIYAGNTLILEDMIIERVYFPARYGGAIYSKGNLTCTDVTFQNCVAMQGGAVFTKDAGTDYNFTRCKFLNNSTLDNTTSGYKLGAAINLGGTSNLNATFDQCLFDSNICDHNPGATDYSKKPEGGAIAIRLLAATSVFKINIKNSAFINNFAYRDGGAILTSVSSGSSATTSLDLNIQNTTFAGNKISPDTDIDGTCLNIANNALYTGNFTLVNNTFYNNSIDKETHRSIVVPNVKFNVTIVNNVFQDALNGIGYSLVVNGPTDDSQGNFISLTGRGNVGDKIGGSLFKTTGWSSYDWGANPINKNHREKYNSDVKLSATMSNNNNGIPYYTFESGSILANGGVNSLIINELEVVPSADIVGSAIKNTTKDVGAYESDYVNALNKSKMNKLRFYPNPTSDKITVEGTEAASIVILDMLGKKCSEICNSQSISTFALKAGQYFIQVLTVDGEVIYEKILKI